jgi:hypothetical protein
LTIERFECRDHIVWMWLKVPGGSDVQSMFGEPGRRWSSASAMSRRWSPSSAGMGMFRERAAGPCRGRGTDAEGGNPRVAVAQWNDMAGPPRMCADGRAVRWVAMRRWLAVVGQSWEWDQPDAMSPAAAMTSLANGPVAYRSEDRGGMAVEGLIGARVNDGNG